ncbi:5-(carboxyamino)imidazole ribonucleotide mutase, partial [bacterium]|nr:5-(carboxyamino)imidazole ribonucleotide mutase [bacterium]
MKKNVGPVVSVLMGSDSDLSIMKEALETLKKFDI